MEVISEKSSICKAKSCLDMAQLPNLPRTINTSAKDLFSLDVVPDPEKVAL